MKIFQHLLQKPLISQYKPQTAFLSARASNYKPTPSNHSLYSKIIGIPHGQPPKPSPSPSPSLVILPGRLRRDIKRPDILPRTASADLQIHIAVQLGHVPARQTGAQMEAVTVLRDHVPHQAALPEAVQRHVRDGRVGGGQVVLTAVSEGDRGQSRHRDPGQAGSGGGNDVS